MELHIGGGRRNIRPSETVKLPREMPHNQGQNKGYAVVLRDRRSLPEGEARERYGIGWLHVEPKIHDIRFFDDIIFAFQAEQSLLLHLRFRPTGQQIVIVIDLGTDEASFHVGVDLARRLRRFRASRNRPGARFDLTGGEEGDHVQQV